MGLARSRPWREYRFFFLSHVGRDKNNPAALSVPLALTKLPALKPPKRCYLRFSGAAPGWFSPVLLRKTGTHTKREGSRGFVRALYSAVLPVCLGFREKKSTHRHLQPCRPELTKFPICPMPVARHENNKIPPWPR